MAHAICIRCGDTKAKALDACPACSFLPETSHDRARSMVATTHSLPEAKLSLISAALMRGETVELPFDQVLAWMDALDGDSRAEPPVRVPGKGCGWLVLCMVFAGLGAVFLLSR
jgi:hypothetical protein